MFITYYTPHNDELYQSEASPDICEKERDRGGPDLPWVVEISDIRDSKIPLRSLPAAAKM